MKNFSDDIQVKNLGSNMGSDWSGTPQRFLKTPIKTVFLGSKQMWALTRSQ